MYFDVDDCSGNVLSEYYCNGSNVGQINYDCSSEGKICENGACIEAPENIIYINSCQELNQTNTIYKLTKKEKMQFGHRYEWFMDTMKPKYKQLMAAKQGIEHKEGKNESQNNKWA